MRGAHGDTGGGGVMDIRDLRCFGAVAETLSMSRAAREARVAQPALSRRIRALESELGVALLSRHPKGVRLTPAGAAFADGSRQLLRDLAGALDRADTTAAGQRGRVVMAATRPAVARGFPTEVQEAPRRPPRSDCRRARLGAAGRVGCGCRWAGGRGRVHGEPVAAGTRRRAALGR